MFVTGVLCNLVVALVIGHVDVVILVSEYIEICHLFTPQLI